MPAVVAQQLKSLFVYKNFDSLLQRPRLLLDANEALAKYAHMCTEAMAVFVYLTRVFDEKYEVLIEPRLSGGLELIKASPSGLGDIGGREQANGLYLAMDLVSKGLELLAGQYVELVVVSLLSKSLEERVIFPYETRIFASEEIRENVQKNIEALSKYSRIFQSLRFLDKLGLKEIATTLSKGYSWFELGDYSNAIKSYREVIEGFRNYLRPKTEKEGQKVLQPLIDDSESRTEKISDLLSKTHSLLSNFEEHHGTHALEEEGVFAHKLVEDITDYMTKKLHYSEKPP